MALLHLASSWAKLYDVELRVVTVDHGLRPEAAAEAAFVAGVCEGLGLLHYTLSWEGIKPNTGVSEAARKARYMLMEEFAADAGAKEILTGHTANDQAETIWMRNARDGNNPQWRGLAGMAGSMLLPSAITVSRPLLACQRDELRAYLVGIGQAWIEDPSNQDHSYERVRVRQALLRSDISTQQICRFAKLGGRQRRITAETVSQLLIASLVVENGPVFSLDQSAVQGSTENVAILALQVMVALAGGREHFISYEQAGKILRMVKGDRHNTGSTIIECKNGLFVFYRESRNFESLHIGPGSRVLWDNRLQVENNSEFSFLSSTCSEEQLLTAEVEQQFGFNLRPRAVLKSMPVLIREDGALFFPFVKGFGQDSGLTLRYRSPAIEFYCSEYDFALLDVVNFVQREMVGMKMPGDQ